MIRFDHFSKSGDNKIYTTQQITEDQAIEAMIEMDEMLVS